MTWADGLLLGVLQGLTEFLPVSSSGHLVLAQHLLGVREPQLLFDVAVHGGTLVAVAAAMRHELGLLAQGVLLWPRWLAGHRLGPQQQAAVRLAGWIALASVPAGVVGVLLDDALEALFGSPRVVAAAMVVTGIVLWMVPARPAGSVPWQQCGAGRALLIGVAQAVAVIPGISRAGATVAAGLWSGLDGAGAARFSFLLSVPAIAGAALLTLSRSLAGELPAPPPEALATGVAAAALTGYGAIRLFLGALRRGRLRWFAVYLWVVAAASWAWGLA